MSINIPYILQRKCKDKDGIRITREYLESFWNQGQPRPLPDTDEAYDQLIQDFLHKDITLTSEAIIPENFGQNTLETFPLGHLRHGGGVVLQIQDTVDICHSALLLLNNLTHATPIRQIYVKRNDSKQLSLPRGMLRWTLTDGKSEIQAMEMETIPDLSLTTPFGCKLLVKGCQVRRGMLLLTKNNIKVLGGDVLELYGGDMLKELENRLKESLRLVSERTLSETRGLVTAQPPLLSSDTSNTTMVENELLGDDDFDDTRLEHMEVDLVEQPDASFDHDLGFFASIDQMSLKNQANLQKIVTLSDSDLYSSTLLSHGDTQQASLNSRKDIGSSPLLSKKNRMMSDSHLCSKKRISLGTRANTTSTAGHRSTREKAPWVDKSPWNDLSETTDKEKEEDDDGVFIDSQGKVHVTFSKLQQALGAIENNGCVGNLPDIVIVRARCIQFGKLVTSNRLYSLVLYFDDPDQASGMPVQIMFSNNVLAKLLDATRQDVVDTNIAGGQKAVLRQIFKPFNKKVRNAIADIEIDLSTTQKSDSGFLLPMGIDYQDKMASLATLIYYPRSIALLSSGIFAGFTLSVTYVSVPSIKASKDPLPSFVTTYRQGAKFAITTTLISSIASGYCYYKTKDPKFLYATLFSSFSAPFTVFFIAPVNNQLFALQKDDSYNINSVYGLVDTWAILHGMRTLAGATAFIINVFM